MKRFAVAAALAITTLLGACASVDHSAALSLGTAGVTATQALSDQTGSMAKTLSQLSPLQGVRVALECTVSAADERAGCRKRAGDPPAPLLSQQIAQISDAITKRKAAVDTLNQAYSAFVDLAKYNAGQEATAALATSFDKVNSFLAATSALPGGAAIQPISATIQNVAAGGLALAADSRQNKQIRAANHDLRVANEAMVKGLTNERGAMDSLLRVLQAEKVSLGRSALAAGLISPTDVVTPIIGQALPGIQFTTPPDANSAEIMLAAQNGLRDQGVVAVATAPETYDDALAALSALSAQHQRFEVQQHLDLSQIEAEIANLQADLAQMNSAPQTPKPAAN